MRSLTVVRFAALAVFAGVGGVSADHDQAGGQANTEVQYRVLVIDDDSLVFDVKKPHSSCRWMRLRSSRIWVTSALFPAAAACDSATAASRIAASR